MPQEVTRRRFMLQTLGVLGGATVSGDLLPLLAEAAKRKQVLRVTDMLLAFPSFVLALVFVAVFRPTLMTLIIALSIRFMPG